jgi:hypothetical protein
MVLGCVTAMAFASDHSSCRELESWPDAELEAFLLEAEVVDVVDVGEGITEPKRVTLRRGDRECRAIFKDVDVESTDIALTNRFEMGFSDKWRYEVAAYRLDRLLDIGLVPVTVERQIEGTQGSLQLWIEDATTLQSAADRDLPIGDERLLLERLMSMYVLDQLIANVDRNFGNVLVRPQLDDFYLIDHSRAFRTSDDVDPPPPPAATPVDPTVARAMRQLDRESVDEALEDLLSKRQRRAILDRRDELVELLEEMRLLPEG